MATSIVEAYRLHFADVARETTDGGTDPSRLDAEVAVRLRLAGHDRDAIARVIKDAAPTLRPGEHRDWDSYARRAVDFAFGVPGSRLAHHLARRREQLTRVEGRPLEGEMATRGRGRAPLGVFAPAFAARAGIVPSTEPAAPRQRPRAGEAAPPKAPKVPNRLPWASLIWRVFLRDVLECARCKGRMEIVAALTSKTAVARVLGHLGLSADTPMTRRD